ncbi:MAG: sulfur transferase domain-containing protein, partial [Woeseia sp.]
MPASEIESAGASLPTTGYLSSGQPNAAALSAIAAAGYAGVVDLRTEGESRGFDEAQTAETLGLGYRSLPIAGPDDVTFENAAKLDALLAEFAGPVLLHCGSGNRVGALFAL